MILEVINPFIIEGATKIRVEKGDIIYIDNDIFNLRRNAYVKKTNQRVLIKYNYQDNWHWKTLYDYIGNRMDTFTYYSFKDISEFKMVVDITISNDRDISLKSLLA